MSFVVNVNREFVGDGYKNVLNKDTNEVIAFPINMSDDEILNVFNTEYKGRPKTDINPSFYETDVQPALDDAKVTGNYSTYFKAMSRNMDISPFGNNIIAGLTMNNFDDKSTEASVESMNHPMQALAGQLIGQTLGIIGTSRLASYFGLGKIAATTGVMAEASVPINIYKIAIGSNRLLPTTLGASINKLSQGLIMSGGIGGLYDGISSYVSEGKKFYDKDINNAPDVLRIGKDILRGAGTWSAYSLGGVFSKELSGIAVGTGTVAGLAYTLTKAEGGSDSDAALNSIVMSAFHISTNVELKPKQASLILDNLKYSIADYIKSKNRITSYGNINEMAANDYINSLRASLLIDKKFKWEARVQEVNKLATEQVKDTPISELDGNSGAVLDYLSKYFEPKDVAKMSPDRRMELYKMDWKDLRDVVVSQEPLSKTEIDAAKARALDLSKNGVSDVDVIQEVAKNILSSSKKLKKVKNDNQKKYGVENKSEVVSNPEEKSILKTNEIKQSEKSVIDLIKEKNKKLLDRAKRTQSEHDEKRVKAEGFILSALIRKLEGKPTEKEYQTELDRLQGNYKGKIVETKDGKGEVVGTAFGKIRVKLVNGDIKSFEVSNIKSKNITEKDVLLSLKNQAEKDARDILVIHGIPIDKQPRTVISMLNPNNTSISKENINAKEAGAEINAGSKKETPIQEKTTSLRVRDTAKTGVEAKQGEIVNTVKISEAKLPVGTGKTKESTLFKRTSDVFEKASGIKINRETYQVHKNKESVAKMLEFVKQNTNEAEQVIRGEILPPKGFLKNDVYVALTKYAEHTDNIELMSRISSLEATRHGQELSVLQEIDPQNPINYGKDIISSRIESYGGKEKYNKRLKSEIDSVKKSIKIPNKEDWAGFIKSIKC